MGNHEIINWVIAIDKPFSYNPAHENELLRLGYSLSIHFILALVYKLSLEHGKESKTYLYLEEWIKAKPVLALTKGIDVDGTTK